MPPEKHPPAEMFEENFDLRDGLLTLKGPLVELRRRLDALFREWATIVGAVEYSFPPVMSVSSLATADYFSSFPHLVTLVSRIDPSEGSVERFVSSARHSSLEQIGKEHLAAARYVLPSAACYAVYIDFRGRQLEEDLFITLLSPCFRHETGYEAGRRQWAFHMREIVCVGSEGSVQYFLGTYREFLKGKMREAGLPFTVAEATDPFFDKRDPRRIIQRLEPLKHEFLFNGSLAIASVNFHRNFFGERFRIRDRTGMVAYSGCVAFGLERWLFACTQQFGPDWNLWPAPLKPSPSAATT